MAHLEDYYFNIVTPPMRNFRLINCFNQVLHNHSMKNIVIVKFDKRLKNSERYIGEVMQEIKTYN